MTRMKAAVVALALFLTAGFANLAPAADDQGGCGMKDMSGCDMKMSGCDMNMSGMDHSQHSAKAKADDKATSASQTSQAVTEVGNTICPITGEKIGSMGDVVTVDYKGQRVNLCCPGCRAKFLKNGDANLKKAQDQAAKASKEKK